MINITSVFLMSIQPLVIAPRPNDGVVRIAFNVYHLGSHDLGFVTQGMDDDPAAHRAVRTDGAGFCSARDLEFPRLRQHRSSVKPKQKCSGCAARPHLEELSSG